MKKASFQIKNNHIIDPDELLLTKEQIHDWIVDIRKGAKNKTLKTFCVAVESMLLFTKEEAVVEFWREVISKVDQILMLNAISHANGNNEAWGDTLGKLYKERIKNE